MSMTGGEAPWLVPSPATELTGDERIVGVDATVGDFWRWAFSDLRDNTNRGILGEFLVARVVGDTRGIRVGWANFDVEAPAGTRIEVKTSAYLQGWAQRHLSRLAFGRLRGLEYFPEANEYSSDERVRADVFVFAVQTQTDPTSYDMLNIADHWRFWVVAADEVREEAGKSVGIARVEKHAVAGNLHIEQLADAILMARDGQNAVIQHRRCPGNGSK